MSCRLKAAIALLEAVAFLPLATNPFQADCHAAQSTTSAPFPGAGLVNNRPPFLVDVQINHPDGVYQLNDLLSIRLKSERKAYLYLLHYSVDGTTRLLFPNGVRPNNLTEGQTVVEVPDSAKEYRFRIKPPCGIESLQLLAAVEPIAELQQLISGQDRLPLIQSDLLQKLSQRLANDSTVWAEHHRAITTYLTRDDAPKRSPARAGLFIGIGKYQHANLAAAHVELSRSAKVMHDVMLRRGGLDPQKTRLLRDGDATKANIEESISRWLAAISQPGDEVFIYFSGHSGQIDNLDGSEPDGKDEALCPYDLDAGSQGASIVQRMASYRQSIILDDTLARWLQELVGRRVVLILDTCFSGGVVDGKAISKWFDDESSRVKDISQLNTVVLTCCGADEQALFEGTPNQTMWFTYFLTQSIETQKPLTVEQAFKFSHQGMERLVRKLQAQQQQPTMTNRALISIDFVLSK